MKYILLFLFAALCASAQTDRTSSPQLKAVIDRSRKATLEISSVSGKSKGSGFLIGKKYAATCFHVVARMWVDGNQVKWDIYPDIKLKSVSGEEVSAKVISIPSQQSPEPITQDFAILELSQEFSSKAGTDILEISSPSFDVGDEVIFSGYPLATPAMVTHRGMISGFDQKNAIICIQGPINKGNSGGALCDINGRVIGIVSMREGGIAVGLSELNAYIEKTSQQGSVTLMGVDPLQAIRAISQTLDQYISTGIGYAHSASTIKKYLNARPGIKL